MSMQLSDSNRRVLLLALHHLIEQYAAGSAADLLRGNASQLDYPPNGGFTEAESQALTALAGKPAFESAVRKVLANCAAGVVFDLLNLLDGTSEPAHGAWSGVALVDKPAGDENTAFLHDDFLDTYWEWRDSRDNKDWHLDLLPE